ncbi:hypothetical protein MRB53_038137 [Persea americana]|nr:hypothetical protein MRB53_038137 [Persea americana]
MQPPHSPNAHPRNLHDADAAAENATATGGRRSQIQRLGGDDVAADLGEGGLEFLLEVRGAHDLGGLAHLAEQLFEAAEEAD